jgi:putative oxidoreductase
MKTFLDRYSEQIYALMRIVAGLLFFCHGAQKLFGWFGGPGGKGGAVDLVSLFGLAGVIEMLCGLLIALGLFAGWVAFLASGEMAVAYFKAHFPGGFWPIENHGELAVLYCFVFLYVAARGAGIWSIDGAMKK